MAKNILTRNIHLCELDFFQVYIVVVTVCFSLCVVLGAHSGGAMWVVRVDMSAKDLLSPIPSSQDCAHGVPA